MLVLHSCRKRKYYLATSINQIQKVIIRTIHNDNKINVKHYRKSMLKLLKHGETLLNFLTTISPEIENVISLVSLYCELQSKRRYPIKITNDNNDLIRKERDGALENYFKEFMAVFLCKKMSTDHAFHQRILEQYHDYIVPQVINEKARKKIISNIVCTLDEEAYNEKYVTGKSVSVNLLEEMAPFNPTIKDRIGSMIASSETGDYHYKIGVMITDLFFENNLIVPFKYDLLFDFG